MHFDYKKEPKGSTVRSGMGFLKLEVLEVLEKMEPAIRVERTTC